MLVLVVHLVVGLAVTHLKVLAALVGRTSISISVTVDLVIYLVNFLVAGSVHRAQRAVVMLRQASS
ncbi:hypothetical protein D3C87_1990270 [compost metagenome]